MYGLCLGSEVTRRIMETPCFQDRDSVLKYTFPLLIRWDSAPPTGCYLWVILTQIQQLEIIPVLRTGYFYHSCLEIPQGPETPG